MNFELKIKIKNRGHIELSDPFVAIASNTTREGNSLKAPLEAIRKQGLIPKKLLPQLSSWDENYNPERITGVLKLLGEEFLKRFVINYEKVFEKDYGEILKKDLVDVAGYAWPEPINNEYPPIDYPPNHAFIVYKRPKYFVFDNYTGIDGFFIKKLSPAYDLLDYGYRITVNKEIVTPQKKSIWQTFLDFLQGWNLKKIYKLT